ncbi:peptidoglycan DD-metalloendopeptidase family protein [Hoyosella sp. YIM 151337]|uniref:peptidoglycan DD-metalloendopeptidase family protein n=1 Tax=Hoyosella sp. YIM 151337 TaxID=2992742 RepID=UPI0035A92429
MASVNSRNLVALGTLALIPLLLFILFATVFQDEEDRTATDCLPGSRMFPGSGGDLIAPPGSFIKPVKPEDVVFTSGFGMRWGTMHQGIDLAGPVGTPIYAAADGVVRHAGSAQGFGLWVVLDHHLGGQLVSTVYGHIDTFSVQDGQKVRAGQQIATMGNRGITTGPHLHFEIWQGGHGGTAVDPHPQYMAAPAPGEQLDRRGELSQLATDTGTSPSPAAAVTPLGDLSRPVPASVGSEANLQVNTTRLMRAVHAKFGDRIDTIGGWRPADPFPDHPSGQAIDVMIPNYSSGAGVALGDEVTDYVLSNADFFGVDYVIWRQMYIKPGQAPSLMQDRGSPTQNHFDHVHVTVRGGGFDDTAMDWGHAPGRTGSYDPMAPIDCVISGDGLGDHLADGSVPPEFAPWITRAGSLCPEIRPSLLAAQIEAESGFRTHAVSSAAAQGPAQFIPTTWASWGRTVDDNGNPTGPPGSGNVNAIPDSVMAQGRYMCHIAQTIDAAITDGRVRAPNGAAELYLAGYNAGEGAVLSAGGFPSGGQYTTETRPYADKILAAEPKYRAMNQQ